MNTNLGPDDDDGLTPKQWREMHKRSPTVVDSYVRNCHVVPKESDETLFTALPDGTVAASLDGYTVLPTSEYERLVSLLDGTEREPMDLIDLLAFFEDNGQGSALISDDAGHWAVSSEGMQTVPDNPPQDISTTFFIDADIWKSTIREALEAFYDDHQ